MIMSHKDMFLRKFLRKHFNWIPSHVSIMVGSREFALILAKAYLKIWQRLLQIYLICWMHCADIPPQITFPALDMYAYLNYKIRIFLQTKYQSMLVVKQTSCVGWDIKRNQRNLSLSDLLVGFDKKCGTPKCYI